jgi:hypothetical protein
MKLQWEIVIVCKFWEVESNFSKLLSPNDDMYALRVWRLILLPQTPCKLLRLIAYKQPWVIG